MQVSVESPSNLGRKLTISVPADKIESAVSNRVKDLAKKVRIDGFRPGKVPTKVVEQRFGKGIREEVAHDLLKSSLFEALQEQQLNPAGTPSVESGEIIAGQDFQFTATFEVFPQIELQDLSGVEVEQIEAQVSQEDIDGMILKLREQNKAWNEVARAAQSGDKANISFDGYKDGQQFEGGKAENFDLELGSGSMIPGFEDQIIGMSAGDAKEITVTFPADYGHEDLAGAEAMFKIDMHQVQEGGLPEINEEFVSKFVDDGSVESFQNDVKTNMERELERSLTAQNKEKVFAAFLEKNPCELPTALVDSEIKSLKEDMIKRVFGNQKVDASKLPPLPDDMFIEQAKKRVQLGLLFAEYIKSNDMKPDSDKVDAWLDKLSQSYDKPDELKAWYRSSKDRMAEIESVVLEEQAVEKMLTVATVKTVAKDYDAVMNPKTAEQPQADASEEAEVASE